MRILGLVASYRKLGNTDILLRIALMRAKELGAEVRAIRLPECDIKVCKACYHCFWEDCKLADDAEWIFSEMAAADALIISSPTYILSIPGILKLLYDRILSLYTRMDKFEGKPAAIIVVYGLKGWIGYALPTISSFLLGIGYRIVDRMEVRAAWPGEVLLYRDVILRAERLGETLYMAAKGGPAKSSYADSYKCPLCGANALEILPNWRVRCVICDIEGRVESRGGTLVIKFDDNLYERSRWDLENRKKHFERLKSMIGEYMKKRKLVEDLLRKYQEFNPYISRAK